MKKIVLSLLISCGLISAQATLYTFDAFLTGFSETPPNGSPAIGFTIVNFDDTANTMQILTTYSGLLGTVSSAHIHAATTVPFTGAAGVATTLPYFAGFPIGTTSGVYSNTLDLTMSSSYNPAYITANGGTTAGAESALLGAMLAGKSYMNIHSSVFTGGEIRGFLTLVPVPEPSSFTMAGLFVAGFAARAWKRKRGSIKT